VRTRQVPWLGPSPYTTLFRSEVEYAEVAALLGVEFDDEHDSMVIVGPTRVQSFCAHHMLPFTGHAWVGYIPDEKVVGLSKLSRLDRKSTRLNSSHVKISYAVF